MRIIQRERDTRKSSGFQFWAKLYTILKCFVYSTIYYTLRQWENKLNAATDVLDGDSDDDDDSHSHSHSHSLSLYPSLSVSLSLSLLSASFSFGVRSYSKYVHQQTEHDAIKLLFIFVFISLQHHTSFSHRQWLRWRGFVAFAFIRSHSLFHSPIRLLVSLHFCCFSFVSKSHFSFIYKTIHQNSIKSVVQHVVHIRSHSNASSTYTICCTYVCVAYSL